jgi:hypothetical protein
MSKDRSSDRKILSSDDCPNNGEVMKRSRFMEVRSIFIFVNWKKCSNLILKYMTIFGAIIINNKNTLK